MLSPGIACKQPLLSLTRICQNYPTTDHLTGIKKDTREMEGKITPTANG